MSLHSSSRPERLQLVDVTLRDGGFHNGWHFDAAAVRDLILALDAAGLDWVELGYRFPAVSHVPAAHAAAQSFGPHRSLGDDLIDHVDHFPVTRRLRFALMIEADAFTPATIDLDFRPASASRVALVRIATRAPDLDHALDLARHLTGLGYLTALNLVDAKAATTVDATALFRTLAKSDLTVVNLADTLGDLYPHELATLIDLWRDVSRDVARNGSPSRAPALGVHLHDALGLAFANALIAIERDVPWLDVSVLGMGRGPGNLRAELVVQHLEHQDKLHGHTPQSPAYNAAPIYDLIAKTWLGLQHRHPWGYHPAHALAAHLGLHPSYPQHLLMLPNLDLATVLTALHTLALQSPARRFDPALLASLDLQTTTGHNE